MRYRGRSHRISRYLKSDYSLALKNGDAKAVAIMFHILSIGQTEEFEAGLKTQLENEYDIADLDNVLLGLSLEDIKGPTEKERERAIRVAMRPERLGNSLTYGEYVC